MVMDGSRNANTKQVFKLANDILEVTYFVFKRCGYFSLYMLIFNTLLK